MDPQTDATPRLEPLPEGFSADRDALHALAVSVISPAREAVTGRIGLRWWPGGFGTPEFGDDGRVVRVEGAWLVDGDSRTAAGADATALGAWFGFAWAVLSELRSSLGAEDPVQLWPEHFDAAFTFSEVTYGASPGDALHPEPYLYVLPRPAPEPSARWNAVGFAGAELGYAALLASSDQVAAARDFLAWK
jgi:hypothetical protein